MVRDVSRRAALRALVVGAGPAAVMLHLPVLARLRDEGALELAMVCDLQHARASDARRTFGFDDETGDGMAALSRADVDVVYLFGSAQLHMQYGLAALRAGKHLFVEKPIAPSYAAACELARAATLHGRVAVGGHNRRFNASLAAARALAGKSGWRQAEAVFHKAEFGRAAPFGARSWLSANGIHALDALVYMMNGLPEELTALASDTGGDAPTMFSALMRWRDGAQGVFLCNNNAGARREEYVFHRPGQTCRIDDKGLLVEQDSGRVQSPPQAVDDSIAAEHRSFLRSIHGGDKPPHLIDALAPSLFLCELIERRFSGRVLLPEAESIRPAARHSTPATILVIQPGQLQSALHRFLPQARLSTPEDLQSSAQERTDIVAAILGRGAAPLTTEMLAKLPRLGIVGVVGLSVASHGAEKLLSRGIVVVNATQTYADSVAEFALGLAILGRRRAFASHENMRRGGWGAMPASGLAGIATRIARRLRPLVRASPVETLLRRLWQAQRSIAAASAAPGPRELRGATVGLIGWSANARAFAKLLLQAQTRVRVYSEHAQDIDLEKSGVERVSLAEALASDVVSLHRGLTPATRHFIGSSELEMLRGGAVFINIARGALVDPHALLARLRRGDVFACLDTFEVEPPVAADPIRALPNVFLTSHIAAGSTDMQDAAADEVARKISDYLGGRAVDRVTAGRLGKMT